MTDSWKCDTCDRHFDSAKNRVELVRKICRGPNLRDYIAYQDFCTDCELYHKKCLKKRRRNNVGSLEGDKV